MPGSFYSAGLQNARGGMWCRGERGQGYERTRPQLTWTHNVCLSSTCDPDGVGLNSLAFWCSQQHLGGSPKVVSSKRTPPRNEGHFFQDIAGLLRYCPMTGPNDWPGKRQ